MIASVYSTLSGKLAGKHPTLGVFVREDGVVYALKKGRNWINPSFEWKRGHHDTRGYRYISIRKKNYWVHRLVAETFIPNPDNKPTVDHYPDRNPDNCSRFNLRWADQSEQCRNTKTYDKAIDLGVRKHDDPKEWDRRYKRYARAHKLVKPLSKEQYKRKKERIKERYNSDPVYRQKVIEKARAYRAKKRAEQNAQPS